MVTNNDAVPSAPESDGKYFVRTLRAATDKAISVQRTVAVTHVEGIKRRRPGATPAELIEELEKQYLAAVVTLGAAAGGVAAVPVVGTSTSVALSVAEIGTFFEATALFTLAVAEIHGTPVEDLDRRRTLILAVLLGNNGAAIVEKTAARTGAHWGRLLVQGIPREQVLKVNRILGRNFVTMYGTKQGILVLGRALPFGIGAAIGASGNAALGYASVKAARRAFGDPPPPPQEGHPGEPGDSQESSPDHTDQRD